MKTQVYLSDFRTAFAQCDRTNFDYEGLEILFDSLTEYEDETGEEIKLDVIALCCEFAQDTPEDIASNYGIDISECEDDDAILETVLEYLNNNTLVCGNAEFNPCITIHLL